MKYRRFGRTGLEVSEIVFGGGAVGGIVIDPDDDTKRAAIRNALDGGINWIDTASQYGQGRSEEALGWLLPEIEPEYENTPYLSTKVRLDEDRLDDIRGQIEESLHASLRRLNRESVDLFQLHNEIGPGFRETGLSAAQVMEVADGLEAMRDEGLTKFIGLTALGDASTVSEALSSGRFDSAQVYYNLLNPSAARAMPPAWAGHDFSGTMAACRAQDMAIMGIRIFAASILATDQRHGREAVLTRDTDVEIEMARSRAAFDVLGEDHGTRAQTALRFGLANPDLSCVVVGMAELDHLSQALGAVEMGALPADAIASLEPVWESGFGGVSGTP
ncbi:MAG: aldo/keto reductase [Alphaproteobacteria bacterium]|nr:aldo/keto reductase [Alphaproteobacteria bacterium]